MALQSSNSTPDVAIVGAGIAGLSCAWALLKSGMSVTVLDRSEVAAQTSFVAAGMLAPISELEPEQPKQFELGIDALHRWPAFADELQSVTGINLDLRSNGTLALGRDRDEAESLARSALIRQRFGVECETLLPSKARRLEPVITPSLRAALSVPGELAVDPRKVCEALAVAVRARGGEIRSFVDVKEIHLETPSGADDSRATGLLLDGGELLRCGQVVIAAGPWSARFNESLPAQSGLPLRPVKGQLLVLEGKPGEPALVEHVLRCGRFYLVPRSDGRMILGATTEDLGFDRSSTVGALYDLIRDAVELVPDVRELRIVETIAGLRPATPDGLVAVGEAVGVRGLSWCSGHYRNGVLLAPLNGSLLAHSLGVKDPNSSHAWNPLLQDAGMGTIAKLSEYASPLRFREPEPAVPVEVPVDRYRANRGF